MTVIYIMASSHSGSTLLSFLLGSHSDVFSLGEFKEFESFFNPNKKNNRNQYNSPCDCGTKVYECPFWSKINENISLEDKKPNDIRLFHEIRKNIKEPIIVDNSKVPELFNFYPQNYIDYRIIHLIRDGRARAYSEEKLGRNFKYALRKWAERNTEIYENFKDHSNYQIIHYENLVKEPQKTLDKILKLVNKRYEIGQIEYQNKEFHSIGGNQKVRKNRPEIKFDSEYLEKISPQRWRDQTYNFKQSLARFGYPMFKNGKIPKD